MKQIIIIALLAALFGASAYAGEEKTFTPIDAQKMIDSCWKKYQEQIDTGITSEMRMATNKAQRCLEEIILNQTDAMFDRSTFNREQASVMLKKMREGLGGMYWEVYNEHRKCQDGHSPVFCGTDKQLYHLAEYSEVLERMIHTMINIRNRGEF